MCLTVCSICQIDAVCLKTLDLVVVISCAGITTPLLKNVTSLSTADVKATRTDLTVNWNAEPRAMPSHLKARFGFLYELQLVVICYYTNLASRKILEQTPSSVLENMTC